MVIGSYQSLRNEIDAEGAAKHDAIGVVRRITGGGAMFMEQGNCMHLLAGGAHLPGGGAELSSRPTPTSTTG